MAEVSAVFWACRRSENFRLPSIASAAKPKRTIAAKATIIKACPFSCFTFWYYEQLHLFYPIIALEKVTVLLSNSTKEQCWSEIMP